MLVIRMARAGTNMPGGPAGLPKTMPTSMSGLPPKFPGAPGLPGLGGKLPTPGGLPADFFTKKK